MKPMEAMGTMTWELDLISRRLWFDGHTVELTNREVEVLARLANVGVGMVVSREKLLGGRSMWPRVVDVTVHNIRKKIKQEGFPSLIETRRLEGYVLLCPVRLVAELKE